ncbi:MAG: sulfur carrier protein ThiS [Nocardioides sp.]|nr:sulfur carrier protein ThiS [Nocardioides sp.]
MKVHVNGEPRELPGPVTVQALVPDGRGVAVAVNGTVVRAAAWSVTTLGEGDRIEVVTAHQGG